MRQRQGQEEPGPEARLRTHGDVPAMEPRQLPREVQPEPGAQDVTVLRGHQPAEACEEAMHLFGGNAEPLVNDMDSRPAASDAHMAADLAPGGCELDGIVE